ncbi:MAG: hypothetical protein FWG62_08090 [Proteobacteria bacterium]|nr:hypothetical protein [Pseudomonadota bacterium]
MKGVRKVLPFFQKVVLIVATLLIFQSTAWSWATYSVLANKLANDTDALFVGHHVCKDINTCQAQRRVHSGGGPDLAIVNVYKAGDLNQEMIQNIMKLCLDAYTLHGGKQTISLSFFKETAEEKVRWFSGVKPFIHLYMKGEK